MNVIFVVLPLGLLLSALALYACVRSIRGGQFDDLQTPAMRALFEDAPVQEEPNQRQLHRGGGRGGAEPTLAAERSEAFGGMWGAEPPANQR